MADNTGFLEAGERIGALTVEALKMQYRLQGHYLTGKLDRSITYKVIGTTDGATVRIDMEDYGITLDQGISPSRIPYGKGTGAKSSKYIQGLKRYAKKRFGVSNKEALSIAIRIAKVQKKQGLSTRNSKKYSKTGKRQGAISAALLETEKEQRELVERTLQASIELFFEQFIKAA